MTRRIKIVLETERTIEISSDRPIGEWCEACGEPAAMLTVAAAARLAGVSAYAAHRWVEAGRLHISDAASEDALICRKSLDSHLRKIGLSSKSLADLMQGRAFESNREAQGIVSEWLADEEVLNAR